MPHHQRRKSGHISAHSSTTDVRKAVSSTDVSKSKRPSMSRRQTPVSAQKLGKSQREREREREKQESLDDERESFPQFCMTCEKQFSPTDDTHVYCSESCRTSDQDISHPDGLQAYSFGTTYSSTIIDESTLRDIVPRASPSRPTSLYTDNSPPMSPGFSAYQPSSAISALRTLNSMNTYRPPSPPSPTESYGIGGGSGSFWPFNRSTANSPSTSYVRPSAGFLSSTYDHGTDMGGSYDVGRPLPSRHPSSNARPRSVQLVTPMVGGR